jgi:hypothetical protein
MLAARIASADGGAGAGAARPFETLASGPSWNRDRPISGMSAIGAGIDAAPGSTFGAALDDGAAAGAVVLPSTAQPAAAQTATRIAIRLRTGSSWRRPNGRASEL